MLHFSVCVHPSFLHWDSLNECGFSEDSTLHMEVCLWVCVFRVSGSQQKGLRMANASPCMASGAMAQVFFPPGGSSLPGSAVMQQGTPITVPSMSTQGGFPVMDLTSGQAPLGPMMPSVPPIPAGVSFLIQIGLTRESVLLPQTADLAYVKQVACSIVDTKVGNVCLCKCVCVNCASWHIRLKLGINCLQVENWKCHHATVEYLVDDQFVFYSLLMSKFNLKSWFHTTVLLGKSEGFNRRLWQSLRKRMKCYNFALLQLQQLAFSPHTVGGEQLGLVLPHQDCVGCVMGLATGSDWDAAREQSWGNLKHNPNLWTELFYDTNFVDLNYYNIWVIAFHPMRSDPFGTLPLSVMSMPLIPLLFFSFLAVTDHWNISQLVITLIC